MALGSGGIMTKAKKRLAVVRPHTATIRAKGGGNRVIKVKGHTSKLNPFKTR